MPYTEGYHGTDEETARKLLEYGFEHEDEHGFPKQLFLAAPFQTYLAHSHGKKNAERTNSENYAIIKAVIPESYVVRNDFGPSSLNLFGDEIERAAIVGLSVYTRRGKLIEGDPVDETNDQWNWVP